MSVSKSDGQTFATGEWLGGDTAESLPALIEIQGEDLIVTDPSRAQTFARWSVNEVTVDRLHEGGVVHLERKGDPDRLVTTTAVQFAETLVLLGARRTGLPQGRNAVVFASVVGALLVLIFGGLYLAAPWVSRRAAEHVPLEIERRLDVQSDVILGKDACETPESRAALETIRRRLDPDLAIRTQVRIVNISVPNAFSLPGGTILLTRGLVEGATSVDEVSGVLAHELAHVKHRHVLAELIENTFLSAVWMLTIGDYSGLLVVDPQTAYRLMTLKHSRAAETEADATALELLRNASISSAGLAAFLERNRIKTADKFAFLTTHPATEDRLRLLRSEGPRTTNPPFDEDTKRALNHASDAYGAAPPHFRILR
jgi:Zn-dependent protease with chaperone function